METIKYTKDDIKTIINRLSNGDIIAFPTDTVFGLACVMDVEAIKKIYVAKGRDFKKPLPMMCNSLKMISDVAYINDNAKKLIDNFMPGAITIVFKKREYVDEYITQGLNTIGIRVPNDEWILKLIDGVGMPIMVTSANISNTGSLLKWEDVYESMNGKIDGIVTEDARGEASSTVVDVTEDITILREGPISMQDIMGVLK